MIIVPACSDNPGHTSARSISKPEDRLFRRWPWQQRLDAGLGQLRRAYNARMGFRFYRRVRLLPGISLNLSRSGPSLCVGIRGAHVTVGRRGVTKTVGIPGTGLFYTSRSGCHTGVHNAHAVAQPLGAAAGDTPPAPPEPAGRGCATILVLLVALVWFVGLVSR